MRVEGTCDICGATGDWEAGIFDDPRAVPTRPPDWAAIYSDRRRRTAVTKWPVVKVACPECER
jgi:hypothetical protein